MRLLYIVSNTIQLYVSSCAKRNQNSYLAAVLSAISVKCHSSPRFAFHFFLIDFVSLPVIFYPALKNNFQFRRLSNADNYTPVLYHSGRISRALQAILRGNFLRSESNFLHFSSFSPDSGTVAGYSATAFFSSHPWLCFFAGLPKSRSIQVDKGQDRSKQTSSRAFTSLKR